MIIVHCAGKSLSEALLFEENGVNMFCTKLVLNVRNNFCTQHVPPMFKLGIFMYWTCNSMNNLSSYFVLVDAKEKTFWQGFTCINSISKPRVSVWGVVILGGHFACICRGFNFYDVKKQNLICLSSLSWIFAGYTGSKNKILQTWFFKLSISKLKYRDFSPYANFITAVFPNYRGSPHFVISHFVIPAISWFPFSDN